MLVPRAREELKEKQNELKLDRLTLTTAKEHLAANTGLETEVEDLRKQISQAREQHERERDGWRRESDTRKAELEDLRKRVSQVREQREREIVGLWLGVNEAFQTLSCLAAAPGSH